MFFRKICTALTSLLTCILITASLNAYAETANNDLLIKAGTPMFARLDTNINSDNPDGLITATIIDGKYTGAKLIGKLTTSKGLEGHPDLTTLHFSLMRLNGKWIKPKNVDAYGIDFDAARIALITETEYDELKHNVHSMSASLLQAYSNADKVKLGTGTDLGILFMSNVS